MNRKGVENRTLCQKCSGTGVVKYPPTTHINPAMVLILGPYIAWADVTCGTCGGCGLVESK